MSNNIFNTNNNNPQTLLQQNQNNSANNIQNMFKNLYDIQNQPELILLIQSL